MCDYISYKNAGVQQLLRDHSQLMSVGHFDFYDPRTLFVNDPKYNAEVQQLLRQMLRIVHGTWKLLITVYFLWCGIRFCTSRHNIFLQATRIMSKTCFRRFLRCPTFNPSSPAYNKCRTVPPLLVARSDWFWKKAATVAFIMVWRSLLCSMPSPLKEFLSRW